MKPVIFFDWDGTLADSMNLCVAEIRQALITMRLPDLPDDVLRQCNGPTFEQSLDILHIPHDRAQEYMTTRLTAELALVPTVNRLFPGVREMLQTLREYADLCIVSNGEHDYIALCLQVFGLTDVFVRTATSVPGAHEGRKSPRAAGRPASGTRRDGRRPAGRHPRGSGERSADDCGMLRLRERRGVQSGILPRRKRGGLDPAAGGFLPDRALITIRNKCFPASLLS